MKSIIALPFIVGTFLLTSCGQSDTNSETESTYRDTITSETMQNGNNMRNDQATEELTKKDSVDVDSMARDSMK